MSLDVYLEIDGIITPQGSGIFVREDGQTKQISEEEWQKRHPGQDPVRVPLTETNQVYHSNITSNLVDMAKACGAYDCCWNPSENNYVFANDLISPLTQAISNLEENPDYYKGYNPPNGWGNYDSFLAFLKGYLEAAKKYPYAKVSVWV